MFYGGGRLGWGAREIGRETVRAPSALCLGFHPQGLFAGTHTAPSDILGMAGMVTLKSVLEHLVVCQGHGKIRSGEGEFGLEIRLRLVGLLEH